MLTVMSYIAVAAVAFLGGMILMAALVANVRFEEDPEPKRRNKVNGQDGEKDQN